MSFVMSNYEDCNALKDMIRHVTFLENIVPAERQMSNFFAVQMYEHLINKMAMITPQSSKGVFEDNTLTSTIKLLEQNNKSWSLYANPIKEFQRQGCKFHQLNRTTDRRPTHREALF